MSYISIFIRIPSKLQNIKTLQVIKYYHNFFMKSNMGYLWNSGNKQAEELTGKYIFDILFVKDKFQGMEGESPLLQPKIMIKDIAKLKINIAKNTLVHRNKMSVVIARTTVDKFKCSWRKKVTQEEKTE